MRLYLVPIRIKKARRYFRSLSCRKPAARLSSPSSRSACLSRWSCVPIPRQNCLLYRFPTSPETCIRPLTPSHSNRLTHEFTDTCVISVWIPTSFDVRPLFQQYGTATYTEGMTLATMEAFLQLKTLFVCQSYNFDLSGSCTSFICPHKGPQKVWYKLICNIYLSTSYPHVCICMAFTLLS